MEKRISRFERKTGFESFTDMVVETAQAWREGSIRGESGDSSIFLNGAFAAHNRNQSPDYQHWAGSVAVAYNRYGG